MSSNIPVSAPDRSTTVCDTPHDNKTNIRTDAFILLAMIDTYLWDAWRAVWILHFTKIAYALEFPLYRINPSNFVVVPSMTWNNITELLLPYTYMINIYRQISNISRTKSQKSQVFLVSSCSCLCPIHWCQVLSREWRCSWSSTDRRCSKYNWEINN